ncbi:hypothetical protein ACKUVQ_11535 [Mycobacterium seoulense]|uniref:hypothetical protein n=1 Tax=Mycobacterium seoulense TaxID=386911 RepID=UPI003CF8D2FD
MSQPPEYPGTPADPHGSEQNNPPGYPPPPGATPPNYGAPPPNYGAPPPNYGGTPPGYGAPPPGYGAPPPGYGAPPPGYGAPPPGYGQPPGYGAPSKPPIIVLDGFNWAWNTFTRNAVALIVPTLVYGLLIGVATALIALSQNIGATGTTSDDYDVTFTTNLTGPGYGLLALGYLIAYAVSAFAQSAFLSGCLDLADGRAVTIGSFFRPRNLGMVFLAVLIVEVLTSIASALCFVPGLVLGIFTQFTAAFVIDRSESAIKGFTSSFSLAGSNFVNALLVWLIAFASILVGFLLCGVGLLVAVPLVALLIIYAYRRLSGGQVVPVPPPGYQPGPPPGPQPV